MNRSATSKSHSTTTANDEASRVVVPSAANSRGSPKPKAMGAANSVPQPRPNTTSEATSHRWDTSESESHTKPIESIWAVVKMADER